jgi:hypothetical protein
MSNGLPPLPHPLLAALAGAALLVVVQQQILERRPPRLLSLEPQVHSSGPAALDLRFSRPLGRASLQARSRLQPPLAHRWLGSETTLRLLLQPGQQVRSPLSLELAGEDRRGRSLAPQRWHWEPRPLLLVVAEVEGGEQLQIQDHDGRWQPISPIWRRIPSVEPLADGSGVVVLAADHQGRQRLWKRTLRPRSLVRHPATLGPPQLGSLQPLGPEGLSFAHLSSNRRGDLVLQWGSQAPGTTVTRWIEPDGRRHDLKLPVSGPILLLPEGEGMVVPTPDGLELRSLRGALAGATERPQVLPGSRMLAAFCPASGQALLVRHWPDFRRSLERVQPGPAPITLWLGSEAVLAASCSPNGDRAWMLLNRWQAAVANELVRLDRTGRIDARLDLRAWTPEPGMPMVYDPVADQLLLTLRRDPRQPARAALVDGRTMALRILPKPVRQALWLPGG